MAASFLAGVFLASCSLGARKLDEAVFHDGPGFKLKLVRYYENLPFHFTGEVFRVQCSSAQTVDSPAHRTQDPGWVTIGNGAAIGSKSAVDVVNLVRKDYLVIDERTLVWLGNGVSVSFDGCGQFREWYPTALPAELLDPAVARPDYAYEDIRVRRDGHVSFTVRSPAFKGGRSVRVQSSDFGQSWMLTPSN